MTSDSAGAVSAADARDHLHDVVLRRISWRLIPFMFALYIMSYLDRINVSFAGLQMNHDLGFSDKVFGFGAGIFFLGYFLFGVPSNLMVEKLGARRWISLIMVIWGCISVLMATVQNEFQFYLLRFLLGVAEAGFFPGMILYLTYWYPRRQHGFAVARFMSAIPAAGVLGGLVSSQVLAMHGFMSLPGWKWLFIITGAPSVFLGIATFYYLTDGPEQASWLKPEEKIWLANTLEQERTTAAAPHEECSMLDAARDRRVWQFALLYFCLTLGMYGFQLWLPQIIHNFGGLSDSTTALLSAIPAVFQAIGMIVIGRSSDKTGERRWHLALAAAVAASGLILSGFVHEPAIALSALSVAAFGIWATVGPFWALATSSLHKRTAACGIGLINSVGNLGGFAGPYIIGEIKSYTADFGVALFAMAGSLVVGGVLAIVTEKMRK